MKPHNTFSRKHQEAGVALLISIFVLLLVSGVALALVANSGSESSLAGNFRSSASAYNAGTAGLEEARGRLSPGSPNYFNTTVAGFIPVGAPLAVGQVRYILNPVNPADVVAPTTAGSPYADTEYQQEWGTPVAGAVVQTINSVWANSAVAGMPGPLYKWVRITPATEKSLNLDINSDGVLDNAIPIYYDSAHLNAGGAPDPSLIVNAAPPATAKQVFQVTALAVLPNGTQHILQSLVAANAINLTLPGALTIDGPSLPASTICGSGSTCNSGGAYLTGNEPVAGGPDALCAGGATLPAIAVSDPTSLTNFTTGATPNKANITGSGGSPSIANASSALANLNTVSEVEALVAQMKSIAGSNTCTTSCGSLNLGTASAPTVTVVDNASGSAFQLNSGTTGYGILVVTGTLDYVNVNSYQGIILMLGTAQFVQSSSKDTTFTGALFMAQDRSTSTGGLLAGPGLGNGAIFNYHHGSAKSTDPSIQYDSCVVNQVESAAVSNYRVVSQREVGN